MIEKRKKEQKFLLTLFLNEQNKGFTLAELLVVVAIIAELVAISIPIFTSQLHKAQVATDMANVRSYYAQLQHEYMETEKIDNSKLRDWVGKGEN